MSIFAGCIYNWKNYVFLNSFNIKIIPHNLRDYYYKHLQYTIMLCSCVLSFVHSICFPVHVHVCQLLFLEVTSSTLDMASTVDGLSVGVIWVAPSHAHVIVATGFPPCMVHVRVTLLPSIIGPIGISVIVGDVVGWSKIGWHSDLQCIMKMLLLIIKDAMLCDQIKHCNLYTID